VREGIFGKNRFQVRTAETPAQALKVLGRLVEKVDHPGARPQPFMERAVDAQAQNAVTAISNRFKAFFDSYHG
jgi:hypothetical protein